MKRITIYLVVALSITALFAQESQEEQTTDEWIKRLIIRSGNFIHGNGGQMFSHARELCGADTNRFTRLLYELAQTNDARLAGRMVRCLGTYGTSAQLPFLYSQVGNTEYGVDAVQSILKLEGITSNSVAMVDGYLSMTNAVLRRDREEICYFMLKNFPIGSSQVDRANIERMALRFAADNSIYNRRFDGMLSDGINGYSFSLRRLSVLRAVQQRGMGRGMNEYTLPFVTNAINELVAYPESELPE